MGGDKKLRWSSHWCSQTEFTSFALELGIEKVVLKGDSETIIQALNADSFYVSTFGHIIEDIRALALNFVSFCFSHVKR